MEYLRIKNWTKWQSYRKDRGTPPWIKVYRNLLTNAEWGELTDAEKGQLVSMWMAAADKKGRISSNAKSIKKMCLLDSEPNINRFLGLGFVSYDGCHDDASMTSNGCHGDAPETETETETETEKHIVQNKFAPSQKFEEIWKIYPSKRGKVDAYERFKRQIKTEEDFQKIYVALGNYMADVTHIRNNGQPDLQWLNGSTWFFRRWRDYTPDAYVPPQKKTHTGPVFGSNRTDKRVAL